MESNEKKQDRCRGAVSLQRSRVWFCWMFFRKERDKFNYIRLCVTPAVLRCPLPCALCCGVDYNDTMSLSAGEHL